MTVNGGYINKLVLFYFSFLSLTLLTTFSLWATINHLHMPTHVFYFLSPLNLIFQCHFPTPNMMRGVFEWLSHNETRESEVE